MTRAPRRPKRQALVLDTTDRRTVADMSHGERSALANDVRAFARALAQWLERAFTFEGRLAILGVEANCQRIVNALGEDPPALDSQGWYARAILHGIAETRQALARQDGETAAGMALHVGELLTRALRQQDRDRARTGGLLRGEQIAKAASGRDMEISDLARRWAVSDELQDKYRSPTAYIHHKTRLSDKTINRRLQAIRNALRQGQ
jgi:hypothetical protein